MTVSRPALSVTGQAPFHPPEGGELVDIGYGEYRWVLDYAGVGDGGGPGGTAVFLHSGVGNAETFHHQIRPVTSRGIRFLAYDRSGHGCSPSARAGETVSDGSEELRRLLGVCAVDRPVHLVGAAAGGRTALEFALRYPHLVSTLTLVCSLAGISDELYPSGTSTLLPPEFLALPAYLRELGPVYRGEDPAGVMQWCQLIEHRSAAAEAEQGGGAAAASAKPAESRNRAIFPGAQGQGKQTPAVVDWAGLASSGGEGGLGIPIQLIAGDADPYVTPAAYRRLAAQIPGARMNTITETGHSPYWERPADFNDVLLSGFVLTAVEGAIG